MVRSGIPDVVEKAFVAALSNRRQHAEGAIIHCSGGDRARNIRQGPVKAGWLQARLRLFSPQPRPSSGWWQRGPRRGGRARGASSPGGRAHRPRPRAGPPAQSHDGSTDCPVGPERRGPRASTCGTAYRSAANTCPREHVDTIRRDSPRRAASADLACPSRPGNHNADTLGACRCDWQGRALTVASRQSRSSLRWDRVETPPDPTWLCPPCSHVEASTLRPRPFGSHTKTR